MTSLTLEPGDGRPLGAAMPGQFIVLRLKPAPDAPALLRSYSLSGEPNERRWRISIKQEPNGAAGTYVEARVQVGDVIDASAPRGAFTLKEGDGPVVLLSAGIGLTPVLAMLQALVAGGSRREIWWITAPAIRQSMRWPRRCRGYSSCCLEAIAAFFTARPAPRIGWRSISMTLGAWTYTSCRRSARLARPISICAGRPRS